MTEPLRVGDKAVFRDERRPSYIRRAHDGLECEVVAMPEEEDPSQYAVRFDTGTVLHATLAELTPAVGSPPSGAPTNG